MRKKFGVVFLALSMTVASLGGTGIEARATEMKAAETQAEETTTEEDVLESFEETVEDSDEDESVEDDTVVCEEGAYTLLPVPAAERIETNFKSIELRVGESVRISANIFPENASQSVTFTAVYDDLGDEGCLSVDSNGHLVANKPGCDAMYIKVSATSDPDISQLIPVKVLSNYIPGLDEDGNSTGEYNTDGEYVVLVDGIWVGGFQRNGLVYTGKPVTQEIAVYNKGEQLVLNKDYSLTYKNNINVCDGNDHKSASVTITMKGQYSGKKTLFYAIDRGSLSNTKLETDKYALTYNGREQKYVPVVTFNGKKLVKNKDFIIEYTDTDFVGDEYSTVEVRYTLTGISNFEGSMNGSYYITPKSGNLCKATITLKTALTTKMYDCSDIKDSDLNIRIKLSGSKTYVDPLADPSSYEVKVIRPSSVPGTGKVVITGTLGSNISGSITKTFKVNPAYNLAKVADVNTSFKSEMEFYPGDNAYLNKQTGDELLTNKETSDLLKEGRDYTVTYSAYNKVGVAKATFKGIGAYTGKLVKTYKLVNSTTAFDPDNCLEYEASVYYTQGGVKNNIKLYDSKNPPYGSTMQKYLLKENVDYTVSYKYNKAVGKASFTIKPKGNYAKAGSITKEFDIIPADIGKCSITIPDKAYTGKPNTYKSTPVITAPNGKKLVVGKDYDKNFEYRFDNDDEYDYPKAGDKVVVTVKGIHNYAGSEIVGYYKIFDSKQYNVSKLYIAIDSQTYTGKAINVDLDNDVHVYVSAADMKNKVNEIKPASDYVRIVSYKNNIKSGVATVVMGGAVGGAYGGTKNVTFKILKKNYDAKSVAGISIDPAGTSEIKCINAIEAKTFLAKVEPADAYNQNVTWSISNPNIAYIEDFDNSSATVRAVSGGTCVLTCTTQEGAKVAKATIKVIMKPVTSIEIKDSSDNTITSLDMKTGDHILLKASYKPEDALVLGGVTWSTTNSEVVTITEDGQVDAVGMGLASITASFESKTVSIPVSVEPGGTLSYVNVTDYGAIADDDKDDTTAFNNALKAVASKPVGFRNLYVPSGTFHINVTGEAGLDMNNATNMYIKMESTTILKTSSADDSAMQGVICLDRARNVIFDGGTIEGNRSNIKFSEDFFGIMCVRSKDIQFKNMTVKNCNGDGIYIGKDNSSNPNRNIYIKNCIVSGCARNNIAIVNADGVIIDNTKSTGATGFVYGGKRLSGLGLDIEPLGAQIAHNIQVNNCTFTGNREEFGIHCHVAKAKCSSSKDITLDRCTFGNLVYIDCGTNLRFTNTIKKPNSYYDKRSNSYKFPG